LPLSERLRLAELGLLGITLPEQYGGAGLPLLFALLAIEEIAKESQTAAFPIFEANTGPARVVELFGTEGQRQRWLRDRRRSCDHGGRDLRGSCGSAATDLAHVAEVRGESSTTRAGPVLASKIGNAAV